MATVSHIPQTADHGAIEDAIDRLSKLGRQLENREQDGHVGLSRTLSVLSAFVIVGLLALVVLLH